jgi:probable HAF family extracellular repeat protein
MVGGSVSSVANGINNSGQVVGYSYMLTGATHATIWNGATPTDLGTLGGQGTFATGINDSGQVVGYGRFDWRFHAVLWNDSTPTDLNSFLSVSEVNAGWYLEMAYGINNNGWIVGNAFNTVLDERHGFLLTPCDTCPINIVQEVPHIPEPETYALFMAGLGLMGFIARRRKNVQA